MNGASSVNPSATTEPAIGGLTPFSSVDWPGQLAAVVFIAGCPWRCGYCHNPQLQPRQRTLDWPAILHWLDSRRGLLDGVVFSGGEPLSEPALADMARAVQARGFAVGLHSAGIYPQRLAQLLPWLDWLALDIKTDQAGYDALTASYGNDKATYGIAWVDGIRGVVRPILTLLFFTMSCIVFGIVVLATAWTGVVTWAE